MGSDNQSRKRSISKQLPKYPLYMDQFRSTPKTISQAHAAAQLLDAHQSAVYASVQSQRDRYYDHFMQKYMRYGLLNFIKQMIDDRVALVLKSEVKRHADLIEGRVMKYVQEALLVSRKRRALVDVVAPETERMQKLRSKRSSVKSGQSRHNSSVAQPHRNSQTKPSPRLNS